MIYDPLKDQLIEIARALQPHGISLIVGGGYGLYLRTELILKTKPVTRFEEPPSARSTEDLDLFLSIEILADASKMKNLRDSISDLGYKPHTEYFQFEKQIKIGSADRNVKIDLLAPIPPAEAGHEIKVGNPRLGNRSVKGIHARRTDEAITLNEGLTELAISGTGSDVKVFLPHPFTYLLLKLFALRDHLQNEKKVKAPEHSADIYRVIGMMTENEWNEAVEFSTRYRDHNVMNEAASIIGDLYASVDAAGPIQAFQLLGKTEITERNMEKVVRDLRDLFLSNFASRA